MTDAPALPTDSTAFYRPLGDGVYQPTIHVQGAWREDEQHMAPVGGLLAHHLSTHEAREDMQLCRITYEILGFIPAAPSTIETRVVRPGRTIELLESTMSVGGRTVVRASGWRLSRQDTSAVAGTHLRQMPRVEDCEPFTGMTQWPGGYIEALDFRVGPGWKQGDGQVWLRADIDLIEGEDACDVASFLRLVDTANGIATRVSPKEWMFPNVDLTIHLFRMPRRGWLGLDTQVSFGSSGLGLTASTLHDEDGPVGRVEQMLTVRPMPPQG